MYNGVLIVRKEKGYTSNDVVAILRGILKQKKIGHTGTLDPDAEGVLPVCLGQATKLAERLTAKEKEYKAGILLGTVTDTQDVSGRVLSRSGQSVSREVFLQACESFQGAYMQTPPMYSAVKIGGQKLYEIARKGKEIERPAREVMIHKLSVDSFAYPEAALTVVCSKGTYIRTLCHDIGQLLGCGACMSSLVRTRSGSFTLEQAMTLEEIKTCLQAGTLGEHILSMEELLHSLPQIRVRNEMEDKMLKNGNRLQTAYLISSSEVGRLADGQLLRVYDLEGKLTAVYCYQKDESYLKAYKMFI